MKSILLLVLVLSPVSFAQDWNCSDPSSSDGSFSYMNFCGLGGSEKQEIRDAFNLARALYVQGKYELCLEQLAIVRQKVGSFQNSDELKQSCDQGVELDRRIADTERREREAFESKIRRQPTSLGKIKMSN